MSRYPLGLFYKEWTGMQREALTLAIEALSWMELRRINERLALRRTTRQLGIRNKSAMRYAFRLIMETTRRRNVVDSIIAQALGREEFDNLSLGIRSFLRIYTYEVKYGEKSLQEVLDIAFLAREILGPKELAPVEKALDQIPFSEISLEGLPDDEVLALRTFHPAWYVRYCVDLLGRKDTIRLLQAPDPPTYIRINSLMGTEEKILERLRQEGVELAEAGLEHTFWVIDHSQPLNLIEAYREGLFTVQDKASVLAGIVAAPEPAMTVLDVCAAPGTKTGHLSQLMENRGQILSLDFSKRRLEIWKREMARLGVENAEAVLGDALKPGSFPDMEADLVLVDPPCTGTGTFNRIPSGKWRLSRRSIERMASIQRRILDNCAEHVKAGGSLVYCTCSITKEENEMVIKGFMYANPSFYLVEASPRLGLPGMIDQSEAQRLYPHLHGCNGFYLARLEKALD